MRHTLFSTKQRGIWKENNLPSHGQACSTYIGQLTISFIFSRGFYCSTNSWFVPFVNSGVHLEYHKGHGSLVNMGKEELNIQLLLNQLVPQKKNVWRKSSGQES